MDESEIRRGGGTTEGGKLATSSFGREGGRDGGREGGKVVG